MRWAIAFLAMTAPVAAQEAVPAFDTCRDIAIERLERELRWHVEGAFAEQVPVADLAGMAYCGEAGIFLCDQEDAADTCHEALTAQQDALRAEVLASLPAPEVVAGRRGMWSDALYPRMHALARARDRLRGKASSQRRVVAGGALRLRRGGSGARVFRG